MTKTRLVAATVAVAVAGSIAAASAAQAATKTKTASTTTALLSTSSCPLVYTRAVDVVDAASLKTALAAARPGDEIRLAAGTYAGDFATTVAGTALAPVVICGPSTAVINGGKTTSGYGLYLNNAPYTSVYGITVTNAQKGIVLDNSSHSVLDGVTITGIGNEGVHFRKATTDSVIRNSTITDTGLVAPEYGEGVYVGSAASNWCTYTACNPDASDRNSIVNNDIGPGVTAEEIDVKEGTTGGTIQGNTFDGSGMADVGSASTKSWVDVKGNSWLITGNTGRYTLYSGMSDSHAATGWGNLNVFSLNVEYVNATGYGVKVASGVTGVKVLTSNVVYGAKSGVSNIKLVNS